MSGDIVQRLKARTCPAGEPWTADDPSTDHGHTDYTHLGVRAGTNACRLGDCWLYWLATNEIERLRADLAAERAEVERLRAAGDALAEALAWWGKGNDAGDAARAAALGGPS